MKLARANCKAGAAARYVPAKCLYAHADRRRRFLFELIDVRRQRPPRRRAAAAGTVWSVAAAAASAESDKRAAYLDCVIA